MEEGCSFTTDSPIIATNGNASTNSQDWNKIMDMMDDALNPGLDSASQQTGGAPTHIVYKKRRYVVRTGKTGALYILCQKKKVYLSQLGVHQK